MQIKKVDDNSWQEILDIQSNEYSIETQERKEDLQRIWLASPETCFICLNDVQRVVGYLLCHTWNEELPPAKDQKVLFDPEKKSLFLHDIAILDEENSLLLGKLLIEELIKEAKKLSYKEITLVALNDAKTFWQKFGFRKIKNTKICKSYGIHSEFMRLEL